MLPATSIKRSALCNLLRQGVVTACTALETYLPTLLRNQLPEVIKLRGRHFVPKDREIGEQFKILDPARMPEKPVSPNRPMLYAAAAGAGLAFGILIAGFMEYRDTTLKTDNDVIFALALPVLALIPELITAEERQARLRRRRRSLGSFRGQGRIGGQRRHRRCLWKRD